MNEFEKYIDIKCDVLDPNSCPIILGNSIVCDGYYSGKTTAIFTHFHTDHTKNFNRTFTNCHHILLTETTLNAIKSLKKSNLNRSNIETLQYGREFHTDKGEKIELINANHVPGSCQVFVTMEENGIKILYSGDFCYPDIQVPKCDYLVLAAEHGTPTFDYYTDKPSILRTIFDKVYNEIMNDKPVEIRANSGTMQDIIAQLEIGNDGNNIPEAVPFLADEKDIGLTEALSNSYDAQFRQIEVATDNYLNELYEERHQPYVRFATAGKNTQQENRGIVIQADVNQEFAKKGPFFTYDQHRWFACLSSHSSYSNILKYVKQASPEFIIVDSTRASKEIATKLANSISEKYQITTIVRA